MHISMPHCRNKAWCCPRRRNMKVSSLLLQLAPTLGNAGLERGVRACLKRTYRQIRDMWGHAVRLPPTHLRWWYRREPRFSDARCTCPSFCDVFNAAMQTESLAVDIAWFGRLCFFVCGAFACVASVLRILYNYPRRPPNHVARSELPQSLDYVARAYAEPSWPVAASCRCDRRPEVEWQDASGGGSHG
jgi:hypothetical protein